MNSIKWGFGVVDQNSDKEAPVLRRLSQTRVLTKPGRAYVVGKLRLLICIIAGLPTACSREADRAEASQAVLRQLHGTVLEYQAVQNSLPRSLSDLCRVKDWMCRPADSANLADGWGRQVTYTITPVGYELKSAGADGRLGTQDDLKISSESEAKRVRAISGCYEAPATTWADLDSGAARRLSFGRLSLDTSSSRREAGAYEVGGAPPAGFSGGIAFWNPMDSDQVAIEWTTGFSRQRLLLKAYGDSLVGRWSAGTDTKEEMRSGTIALKRRLCPA